MGRIGGGEGVDSGQERGTKRVSECVSLGGMKHYATRVGKTIMAWLDADAARAGVVGGSQEPYSDSASASYGAFCSGVIWLHAALAARLIRLRVIRPSCL